MPNHYGRFAWVPMLARIAMVVCLAAIAISFVLTLAYAILYWGEPDAWTVAWRFVLAIVLEAAAALVVIVWYGVVCVVTATYARVSGLNGSLRRLQSVMQASQEHLKTLTDLGTLSDQAKAMIYHDREIEAVQEVVHACLVRQDYAQAEAVINRMEAQLGYRDEAERLRAVVANSRAASQDGKIAAAVGRVKQIIAHRNWPRAQREAQRLSEAFPNHEQVIALGKLIAEKKNDHKRQLLRDYDAAVKRNDVDASIELLRQLDRYLTAPEAAALEESARGVFRAKLHSLGVRFAIAVTEERWRQAGATGEEIIQEFPNSRMAEEVRQKLDALHHLADESPETG